MSLAPAPRQDNTNWAEGLVRQLDPTHEGRNSWLINHGVSEEAQALRKKWEAEHGKAIPPSGDLDDRMKLQRAEFDAAANFTEQYRRCSQTAVVDDDYPEMRHYYESAVHRLIGAFKANGREWRNFP